MSYMCSLEMISREPQIAIVSDLIRASIGCPTDRNATVTFAAHTQLSGVRESEDGSQ